MPRDFFLIEKKKLVIEVTGLDNISQGYLTFVTIGRIPAAEVEWKADSSKLSTKQVRKGRDLSKACWRPKFAITQSTSSFLRLLLTFKTIFLEQF